MSEEPYLIADPFDVEISECVLTRGTSLMMLASCQGPLENYLLTFLRHLHPSHPPISASLLPPSVCRLVRLGSARLPRQ